MTKAPGEGEPRSEGLGEGQEQRATTPTVEDLKQQRVALEARFVEIQRQKEANVKKQLGDREATISEDRRLVSMLEEAQKTLNFFETQEQGGLLTEPKDQEDLRLLRELITALQQQREESSQKYDAIMNVPEVKDEVLKDAYVEHEERELREEIKKAEVDLDKRADDIFIQMQERVYKFVEILARREEAERMLQNASKELGPIVIEAQSTSKSGETRLTLGSYDKPGYLKRLMLLRKKLGLFESSEKTAIDMVIVKNNAKVLKYEELLDNYEQAQAEMDAISQDGSVDEAHLALMTDAIKKEDELKNKFGDQRIDLFIHTRGRINQHAADFAGIKRFDGSKKVTIGKYTQWNDALVEPKNSVMSSLQHRLGEAAMRLRQSFK